MGCGCNKNTVTKYRVFDDKGGYKDYLTQGEADQARKHGGYTQPVQAVKVAR